MDPARSRPDTSEPEPTSPVDRPGVASQPTIHIVTQDDCFKHVFRRTKERSTIYERPERLRFVNLGLAAALAWHSLRNPDSPARLPAPPSATDEPPSSFPLVLTPQVTFTKTTRKIAPHDPAFAHIHDQPNRPPSPDPATASSSQPHPDRFATFHSSKTYLEQLISLCLQASDLNLDGLSEVPEHLPQGDLYLSPGSEAAILGSIGTCYTAIDSVLKAEQKGEDGTYKKAFVNVRPPGHHCTNAEPMGFCWVNNVLIGCMYSHLNYGIDRICIVDIDLHHGNGSQEIVWRINEQAGLLPPSGPADQKRRLLISYSSLHDINSYPCEDGDPARIKDASLNICVGNAINQFIQNLHLEDWSDEPDFFERLYPKTWQAFEQHMSAFFRITAADPDRSLIFVSAGFDACEHESEDMSRYGKKLPTAFFQRFAGDMSRFSEAHCRGRLISVLEGGYSERALTGSSLSYMLGLMGCGGLESEGGVAWEAGLLERLVRLCKRGGEPGRRGQPAKGGEEPGDAERRWLAETRRVFEAVDGFGQAQNALKSVARREQKQRLLQQNLGLLDARSPHGPRRSQRHASASRPQQLPSTPPKPDPLPPRPSAPASPASELSSPLSSAHESSADDAPDLDSRAPGPSIDSLFSGLQLGPASLPPPPPPAQPVASSSAPAQQHHLPKVKIVWKAGGVFGSSHNSNPPSQPPSDQTGHHEHQK
ncbi:hypothetical protein PtB15_9B529 [Puccinia triticina]|nr:hypothetical protein PtB15_9B529 [Puccinia triticina]